MSDENLKGKDVYELLNSSGQMDKIIDLFSEATDEEMLPEHRNIIKANVKTIASKLDEMIIILREVENDPEKKKELLRELERQKHKMPTTEHTDE